MIEPIYALTDSGYAALHSIAGDMPELFMHDDSQELINTIRQSIERNDEWDEEPFSRNRKWHPLKSFGAIVDDVVPGPTNDSNHSRYIREALPMLTASEICDVRVLASINCFHLGGNYVKTRWQTSSLANSKNKSDMEKFVKLHWLECDFQANSAARLFWLHEYATRAAVYSKFDAEVLLDKMANNVNFFHQILRRRYLMASDRIRAAILDISIESGLADSDKTSEVSKMMRLLNRTAGGISLDILSDEELRSRIKDVMPPKGDTVPSPQP